MTNDRQPVAQPTIAVATRCIALVDGNPAMRHARQLMLRSEGYDVRAYPSCAALLADPSALRSACVVADVEMDGVGGLALLHGLRRAGWHGAAILLADTIPPELAASAAAEQFVALLPKALADKPLLDAIRAAIARAAANDWTVPDPPAADPPPSGAPPSLPATLAVAMVASASTPLLLLDGALGIVAASLTFCRAFGIDPAKVDGRSLFALGAGEWDSPKLRSLLSATMSSGAKIDAYQMDLVRVGQVPRRLVLNAHKLAYDDQDGARLLLAVADMTQAREHEKHMDDLVREKAVLLKELQHRVANSLQMIASVLMQSARNTQSHETRGHLHDAHHRLMSVASVQRQLAASTLGDVALRPYLTQLCSSIAASMIQDHAQLQLEVTADRSSVGADTSISLGLIVTELVINALKHAFPQHRHGRIMVDYRSTADDWTLSVSDNGVGMSPGIGAATPGLGTTIVQALAKQLHGSVLIADAAPGTRVTITRTALKLAKPTVEPELEAA